MRNAMWIGGGITGMGEIPILGVREKGIAKVIRDIFRNGEKGFFYDPSDMGMLHQSLARSSEVVASGQPVSVFLDKSQQLKLKTIFEKASFSNVSELIIGSKVTASIEGGAIKFTGGGGLYSSGYNHVSMSGVGIYPVGNRYRISFEAKWVSGGDLEAGVAFSLACVVSPVENSGDWKSYTGEATNYALGESYRPLAFAAATGAVWLIRNIKCEVVQGNHTYQTNSAARPIFKQKPILGSELVANGDFSNGTTGWSSLGCTFTVGDGVAKIVATGGGMPARIQRTFTTEVGKKYRLSLFTRKPSGDGTFVGAWITGASTPYSRNPQGVVQEVVFTATATSYTLNIDMGSTVAAGEVAYIDNISVKEILGYRTDQNYIEYDNVDDKLVTNLPTPLTNATVLRAIPNVGTQVKYNQTLPMLYEDSTNHAGLVAINRALTRKEQLRLMDELDKRAGAVGFDTTTFKMFDNSQEGFFYDPNDLSTLFQDAAGTVAVTAVGQPVGLIRDKSGRNNHAFQTNSASRPILRQNAVTGANYLEFDGSDDFLQTNNIDFTGTDKVSLFAAIRKLSTVAGMVFELSANSGSNNGAFYLASPAGATIPNQVIFLNKGTTFSTAQNPDLPPPRDVVVSAKGDISNDTTLIRTNGLQFSSASDLGTGNYGKYPLYIGRRAGTTFPFNGHIYGLIGVGKLVSSNETIAIEKEIAKRTGVTLNV